MDAKISHHARFSKKSYPLINSLGAFLHGLTAGRAKTFPPHHLNMNNHQVFSRVSFLLLWINKLMGCGNACGHGIAIKRAKKGP